MPLANLSHSLSILTNSLGLSSVGVDGFFCLVGSSSTGTAGFYLYQGTDTQQVYDDLGDGILPNQVAKHLLRSGGKPTLALKVAPSTAGSSSAITRSNGTVGPLPTLTLTPNDQYENVLVIGTGGAVGTATFTYSTDGGNTYSEELATAATYLLPTGVTVNFTAGTYVAGETYSWTDTAPALTSGDVGTAMDTITASAYDPEAVHILGQAADAAGSLTVATIVGTKVTAAWAAKKFYWGAFEAPAVDKSTIIAAFPAFSNYGVVGCGGFCELVNEKTSKIEKRSSGRVFMPRVARQPLAVQPMRTEADDDLEAHGDIYELVPDGAAASTGYHDEGSTAGFTAARFNSLRTFTAYEGFYTSQAVTLGAAGNDFQVLPYLRIILKVARSWYVFGLRQLGRRLPKQRGTSYISAKFADALELAGQRRIAADLGNQISMVRVRINRTDDVTADPTLRAKVRVKVDSYIFEMESEIGLADNLE